MNISFDPLHMHTGLLVFFVTLVAVRGFRPNALPLIAVIVVEVVVLWSGLTGPETQARPALNSFLSAIIWPFVIVVLGRLGFLTALGVGGPRADQDRTSRGQRQ